MFFLAFLTHSLLDCFTTWGTQLFWPIPTRVAWKTIFVVDPLYTIPYMVCLTWILFLPKTSSKRKTINWIGILLSSSYLLLTAINKQLINSKFKEIIEETGITYSNMDTRPLPFQNILWTANVETETKFHIFYFSWLDTKQQKSHSIDKNHYLLEPYLGYDQIRKLIQISEGFYTIARHEDHLIFNDLRFGQTLGWLDPNSPFVFSYKIVPQNNSIKIEEVEKKVQQAKGMLPLLFERIKGEF